jgi:hypothetical protein
MKQYIIMNKDENRLQVDNEFGLFTLSGFLGNKYVKQFKPVIYKSKWLAKWKAWQYECVVVEVDTSEVKPKPLFGINTWLLHKETKIAHSFFEGEIDQYTKIKFTEFNFQGDIK